MKREIKFRAWDKNIGMYDMKNISLPNTVDPLRHLGVVIMQFTGLKDKNGVEIYEGDIVKSVGYDLNDKQFDCIDKIIYKGSGFRIGENGALLELGCTFGDEVEIIGNIYENPNLLK